MGIFDYSKRIPEVYGALITLGLIAFFFFMRIFGGLLIEFRMFNLIILSAGIYFALKQYKRTHKGQLNYFRALAIGVSSSFIGVSVFALFLFIYTNVNRDFMQMLKAYDLIPPPLQCG